MFPFSSVGTLVFLLADLFSSCEVPVIHSLFSKVTDLSAGAGCSVSRSRTRVAMPQINDTKDKLYLELHTTQSTRMNVAMC